MPSTDLARSRQFPERRQRLRWPSPGRGSSLASVIGAFLLVPVHRWITMFDCVDRVRSPPRRSSQRGLSGIRNEDQHRRHEQRDATRQPDKTGAASALSARMKPTKGSSVKALASIDLVDKIAA